MKDRLERGEQLRRGEKIVSANGKYLLIMQHDGNLVHKAVWEKPDDVHWSWGTEPDGVRAIMQHDGNFCVYGENDKYLEGSDTNGEGAKVIICQDDGNLCIYGDDMKSALWQTGQADTHEPGLSFDCELGVVSAGAGTWKLVGRKTDTNDQVECIVNGIGGGAQIGAAGSWGTLRLRKDWYRSGRSCTFQMNGLSILGGYLNINLFSEGGSWVGTFHGGSVGVGIFESAGNATFNEEPVELGERWD